MADKNDDMNKTFENLGRSVSPAPGSAAVVPLRQEDVKALLGHLKTIADTAEKQQARTATNTKAINRLTVAMGVVLLAMGGQLWRMQVLNTAQTAAVDQVTARKQQLDERHQAAKDMADRLTNVVDEVRAAKRASKEAAAQSAEAEAAAADVQVRIVPPKQRPAVRKKAAAAATKARKLRAEL